MSDQQMSRSPFSLSRLALYALVVLAFSLPFEVEAPGMAIGVLRLTNLEILLGAVLLLTAALVVRERRWRREGWLRLPAGWLWLWGALVVAISLSAVLAPEHRFNAIKATGRVISGLLLALAIPQLVQRRHDLHWVVGGLLAGGMLSISVGLAELIVPAPLAWLDTFRLMATTAGPFMRLTASFNHANQAAMFIEATLPLLVAVFWLARSGRIGHRRLLLVAGAIATVLYLEASILTYSRSSFVTIFVSNGAVAALLWWRHGRTQKRWAALWGGVAGLVILFIGLNAAVNPVVRLRLSSEGDNEWYDLAFTVPEDVTVPAGETVTVTVGIENQGLLHWSSEGRKPIRLGGEWHLAGGEGTLAFRPRWPLPHEVAPDESVTVTVPLRAPRMAGTYHFQWDMVQENVIWFSRKNGIRSSSRVTVLPNENPPPVTETDEMEKAMSTVEAPPQETAPIPGRGALWRVAGQQILAHPLLGIGLDNFRLTYGRYLGGGVWNTSIHTNNWYIETLVSWGILGSLLFFLWLLLLLLQFVRTLRHPTVTIWQVALIIGLLAYLVHGLLDYFLLFHSTALLFWLLVGLWASQTIAVAGPGKRTRVQDN